MLLLYKRYYGFDKGSSGIKIAEITQVNGRLTITRLMKLSLPVEDLPLRPDITPSRVVDLLRQFCRKQGVAGHKVAANLSGAFVASRLFNLPVMSHAELQRYIQDHAQEYLPAGVSKDEVEFDFQILKEEIQTGAEMAQIILAAGRKEAVADVLSMTLGAGLYPSHIDASSLSLMNIFALHPEFILGRVATIMDIGHSLTKTLVVRDGQVAFTYETAGGGDLVNRKLQETFDLEYSAAEELKLTFSQQAHSGQAGPMEVAGKEFVFTDVREAVHAGCAAMVEEIGHVQQLWKGGRPWQHVVITGGGALTPDVAQALSVRFECPVEVMASVPGLACEAALLPKAQEFSLALGLALKQVQPLSNSIDLIPQERKRAIGDEAAKKLVFRWRDYLGYATAVAAALLLLFWMSFLGLTKSSERQWRGINDQWQEARAIQEINQSLQRNLAIIRSLPGGELDCSELLFELSRVAPERLWFNSVAVTSRLEQDAGQEGQLATALKLKLTGSAEAEDPLIQLMRSLEKSRYFTRPELRVMERPRDAIVNGPLRFEITAGIQ